MNDSLYISLSTHFLLCLSLFSLPSKVDVIRKFHAYNNVGLHGHEPASIGPSFSSAYFDQIVHFRWSHYTNKKERLSIIESYITFSLSLPIESKTLPKKKTSNNRQKHQGINSFSLSPSKVDYSDSMYILQDSKKYAMSSLPINYYL